jgi:hypothetical protein
MLDNILIIVILFTIILSFSIVRIWRKKYFVKEIYISEGATIASSIITIAVTIELLTIYFVTSRVLPYSWLYLLIVLLVDLILLLVYSIDATTCIYLNNEILIYKNIFFSKEVLIDKNTKIIEKIDRRIIKSKKNSISISSRYLTGNINSIINMIIKLKHS